MIEMAAENAVLDAIAPVATALSDEDDPDC
jgi:hypothetical protein